MAEGPSSIGRREKGRRGLREAKGKPSPICPVKEQMKTHFEHHYRKAVSLGAGSAILYLNEYTAAYPCTITSFPFAWNLIGDGGKTHKHEKMSLINDPNW